MARTRVLFLCIGNSCRSQMAEGFARTYGSDVIEAYSAGLYPASTVAALTRKVMLEKNIDLATSYPKGIEHIPEEMDMVVNMSGERFTPRNGTLVEDWPVMDPIGLSEDVFRQVANEIEQRVMRLVLILRAKQNAGPGPAGPKGDSRGGKPLRV